ncbi:MAG: hypothetical protein IKM88_01590 [Lachnospiraceae bacterium]|nr:hypothetical protein [Lachnospiraceae bacterium]
MSIYERRVADEEETFMDISGCILSPCVDFSADQSDGSAAADAGRQCF